MGADVVGKWVHVEEHDHSVPAVDRLLHRIERPVDLSQADVEDGKGGRGDRLRLRELAKPDEDALCLVGPPRSGEGVAQHREEEGALPGKGDGFLQLVDRLRVHRLVEVAIIGFLEVGDDGLPRRALVTHHWMVQENGLQLEWVGEAEAVPTGAPNQIYYRLRLDLVTANGRYGAGVFFVEGIFNLDGTGDARNLFGKLCFGGNSS